MEKLGEELIIDALVNRNQDSVTILMNYLYHHNHFSQETAYPRETGSKLWIEKNDRGYWGVLEQKYGQ